LVGTGSCIGRTGAGAPDGEAAVPDTGADGWAFLDVVAEGTAEAEAGLAGPGSVLPGEVAGVVGMDPEGDGAATAAETFPPDAMATGAAATVPERVNSARAITHALRFFTITVPPIR
jgi:hypothetical protein